MSCSLLYIQHHSFISPRWLIKQLNSEEILFLHHQKYFSRGGAPPRESALMPAELHKFIIVRPSQCLSRNSSRSQEKWKLICAHQLDPSHRFCLDESSADVKPQINEQPIDNFFVVWLRLWASVFLSIWFFVKAQASKTHCRLNFRHSEKL